MTNEQPFTDLYSGLIDHKYESIWLRLEFDKIIFWWYVLQGHSEKDFWKLIGLSIVREAFGKFLAWHHNSTMR